MAAVGQPWPFYRPERFSNGLQALVGAGGWEGEGGGGGRKGGVGLGEGLCSFGGLEGLLREPWGWPGWPEKKNKVVVQTFLLCSCANFCAFLAR